MVSKAIVIGGNGALGRAMVSGFRKGWEVTSIDFSENQQATSNVLVKTSQGLQERAEFCLGQLEGKYNAIVCVAGGFLMGAVQGKKVFEDTIRAFDMNFYPSLLAAHFATSLLSENGLLLFTGAAAVFNKAVPPIFSYGLSKAAVHSLAFSMAMREGIPSTASVVSILPTMIDTEDNRKAMPDADFAEWANTADIAELVKKWAGGEHRPTNGSFVLLNVKEGGIVPEIVSY